jgi:hypothetical protein
MSSKKKEDANAAAVATAAHHARGGSGSGPIMHMSKFNIVNKLMLLTLLAAVIYVCVVM